MGFTLIHGVHKPLIYVTRKLVSVMFILYSIILTLFLYSVSLTSASDKLLVDVRVGFSFALAGSDRVDIYVGASRRTDQQDNIPTSADMQSNIDVRILNNMLYVLRSRKVIVQVLALFVSIEYEKPANMQLKCYPLYPSCM